jgi:hypothetical protein
MIENADDLRPVTTITFFRYAGMKKLWALQQMQTAKKPLSCIPGLLFFKLLGSGHGNGFSLKPDFSTFALLCSWENLKVAQSFFEESPVFASFKDHTIEYWTLYMHTLVSHGKWSGVSPFKPVNNTKADAHEVVAVITRASLHTKHLLNFWKHVPSVSQAIQNRPGLIFTKGIGEVPLIHQATFSLWNSQKDMMAFAYQNPLHTEVIKKTRELGWYKEELFARFKPFYSQGTWYGKNLLSSFLSPQISQPV